MPKKTHVSSRSEQQLEKAAEKFDKFSEDVKSLSTDADRKSIPEKESEPQTKLSKNEAKTLDAPTIKPNRAIFSKEKFDEKYRKDQEERSKYVKCIVENNEIVGESVQFWKKEWPGTPAQEWIVPVNKPVYIPRYIAEHLARRTYVRYVMQENQNVREGDITHSMVAKETRHRIDCRSVDFGFAPIAANDS